MRKACSHYLLLQSIIHATKQIHCYDRRTMYKSGCAMKKLKELTSLDMIDTFIQSHELSFLYISRPDCSVCHGLLPQVQQLMMKYPEIALGYIDAHTIKEVAGHLSIFTVPVLLLFVDGKEYIREARIVHLDLLDDKINKVYENVISNQH